ncbi:hypothetical protein CRU99_07770 [Malaciobacter mytili]|uniref:hypothetical protein n=1 Tax=Malaciobacter mytili TaxID=603050 RepID=UPI00100A535F|nr:hypothetical protein [Malaciobacter mytili]RXI43423.1 hypothetical protein CRU99_07770 [Malaciobacter mytili]
MNENNITESIELEKKQGLKKTNNIQSQSESIVFKAERIFAKNWFVIAFISISLAFYSVYVSEKNANAVLQLEKMVQNNNLYAIMTTIDGRSIKVTKTKLEAKFIEKWLANTIVSNFIVSRSEITKDGKQSKFTSPKDVIKNSFKLQFIYSDLMSKKDVQSQKDLRTYLFKLQAMIAEDNLPEYITIREYTSEYFTFKENTFEIKVNVKVLTNNYDISTDQYYLKKGVIPISVKGYVDLSKSTELNPYGLIIETFNIGVITKG